MNIIKHIDRSGGNVEKRLYDFCLIEIISNYVGRSLLLCCIVLSGNFYQLVLANERGLGRNEMPMDIFPINDNLSIYENSYAIVIGIDHYKHLPTLGGAVRDATNIANTMKKRGMQVTLLLNENANKNKITEILGDILPLQLEKNSRVLIYFAGHGVSIGNSEHVMGYLMPVNGQRNRIRSTGISMRELQAWVSGYSSKHVMFIADACYSGLALSTRSTGLSPKLPDYLEQVIKRPVQVVLTAGGSGEEAHEWRGQGLFTYFFMKGIDGAADSNGDRVVTSDELSAYLKYNVTQTALDEFGASQHPQMGRRGEGEFIFFYEDLPKETMKIQFNIVYRPQGKGRLKSIQDGSVLHSGDHYKIIFTTDENAYIYIYQTDSVGDIYQLFPMKSFQGHTLNNLNPVKANITYTLPSKGKEFYLDDHTGTEQIYIVTSRMRNEELENLYKQLQNSRIQQRIKDRKINHQQTSTSESKMKYYFKKRGVGGIVVDDTNNSLQVQWGKKDDLMIMKRQIGNLCSGCVHKIEFEHR